MDCDRAVFHGEAPQLPYGAPIVSYSQRFSGQQVLPAQVSYHLANACFFLFVKNVSFG